MPACTVSRVPPCSWMTSARWGTAMSRRGSSSRPCSSFDLAAQREQQHAAEVRMVGVAQDRAAQHLEALARVVHAAAGGVGQRDDAVDGRVVAQDAPLLDLCGDEPRHAGRAVHRREQPDHVARADLAVAATEAVERAVGHGTRWRGPVGAGSSSASVASADSRGCGHGRARPGAMAALAYPMTSPYLRTGSPDGDGAAAPPCARTGLALTVTTRIAVDRERCPAGVSRPTTRRRRLGAGGSGQRGRWSRHGHGLAGWRLRTAVKSTTCVDIRCLHRLSCAGPSAMGHVRTARYTQQAAHGERCGGRQ